MLHPAREAGGWLASFGTSTGGGGDPAPGWLREFGMYQTMNAVKTMATTNPVQKTHQYHAGCRGQFQANETTLGRWCRVCESPCGEREIVSTSVLTSLTCC